LLLSFKFRSNDYVDFGRPHMFALANHLWIQSSVRLPLLGVSHVKIKSTRDKMNFITNHTDGINETRRKHEASPPLFASRLHARADIAPKSSHVFALFVDATCPHARRRAARKRASARRAFESFLRKSFAVASKK
jgi:hypothetical protein